MKKIRKEIKNMRKTIKRKQGKKIKSERFTNFSFKKKQKKFHQIKAPIMKRANKIDVKPGFY